MENVQKSFEMTITDDVIKIILEYVGCLEFTKFNIINKEFNKIYNSLQTKCKCLKYKNLISCSKHNNGYSHIIKILNQFGSGKKSIHFDTLEDMEIAKPYIYELGTISHFCCGGKGVMFLDQEDNLLSEVANDVNINNDIEFAYLPNLVGS